MQHSRNTTLALATLAAIGLVAAPSHAQVAGTSSGIFSGYTGGPDNLTPVVTGLNTPTFTFGTPNSSTDVTNTFSFAGGSFSTGFNTPFSIGTFTYTNGTTILGTGVDSADLKTTLAFSAPAGLGGTSQNFTYNIPVTITPNTSDPAASADFITLPGGQPSTVFTYGGTTYTLKLSGFDVSSLSAADGFLTGPGGVGDPGTTELHVFEGHTATAGITGVLTESTAVPEPSSVAAFAFTGLGAVGLMFKARRSKSVA